MSSSLPTVTTATPPASSRIAVRNNSASTSADASAIGAGEAGIWDIVEGLLIWVRPKRATGDGQAVAAVR
jgi:hypothetical protein